MNWVAVAADQEPRDGEVRVGQERAVSREEAVANVTEA